MTAEIVSADPWATLDDLLGIRVDETVDQGIGDLAVAGRVEGPASGLERRRLRTARTAERSERPTVRPYLFRGRIRCAVCGRKMEASPRKHGMHYRRPARTLASGSAALATHPPAVYLREDPLADAVNGWLGGLFDRRNRDRTVAALVGSQGEVSSGRDTAKARLAEVEGKVRRLQAAIEAGVDPTALVQSINEAHPRPRSGRGTRSSR